MRYRNLYLFLKKVLNFIEFFHFFEKSIKNHQVFSFYCENLVTLFKDVMKKK